METIIEKDLAFEHSQHDTYTKDCSTCFAENLKMKPSCEYCEDRGYIEVMGDGDNFEWDVVGHKRCVCQED